MELLRFAIDFVLHVDQHLLELFNHYGAWIFAILFLIIFCETGLVVTPFLPGDSLLFATGALIAASSMNVHLMAVTLVAAAVLGNAVNYAIGRFFGNQLFSDPDSKLFRRDYLSRAETFFAKYGGRAIVLTRFAPIIRTFVPFAAGMGNMHYGRFLAYNATGGVAWVALFLYAGFFFGNLPAVRQNFTLVVLAIVVVSFVPVLVEWWRARTQNR
ncbi:MAG TPA: DedA family protein [Candidatus Acidoferrum sp.]|nr:DedA family protein [Candidatus Acidoferrum sp.]